MKFKLIILLTLLSLTTGIAEDPMTLNLIEGKNEFYVEDYFPSFTVSYLVNQYPEIDSVSYLEYGQNLGYVNVFGGIGTDFLISPGIKYEIHTSKEISINLIS